MTDPLIEDLDQVTAATLARVRHPRWLRVQIEVALERGATPAAAVCWALDFCRRSRQYGEARMASPEEVAEIIRRALRNEAVAAGFRGNNHEELAARHGISVREVRRILHG